ncbi:MAG TPA: ribonuclease E/G, partial [Nocardioides sp.]|nr:ribonuclease E/G [Nocardioides sp.]
TGKFTGSGGNLEETVTKNNLEAAEEIVRQLRLRDIGGIIVVDFIDMVLESNRDLVLRRLVECLGRDRTRHQVAEVTSLGLVQMTRKRIGTGLVESFSENCEHCQGRGVVIQDTPVEPRKPEEESRRGGRRSRGGRGRQDDDTTEQKPSIPTPKDVAAVARPENAEHAADGDVEPTPVEKPADRPVEKAVEKSAERTGNRRGRAEKPAQTPVEDVVEPTRVEEPVVEPPAAPEPPKVVTRARRRSASRPTTTTAAMPVVIQAEAAAEPTPAEHAPTAEPPKVVTRTRGRSATRPAGPPSAVEAPGSAADGAPTVPGLDGEAHHDAHPVEHVPIKKKGARKR